MTPVEIVQVHGISSMKSGSGGETRRGEEGDRAPPPPPPLFFLRLGLNFN